MNPSFTLGTSGFQMKHTGQQVLGSRPQGGVPMTRETGGTSGGEADRGWETNPFLAVHHYNGAIFSIAMSEPDSDLHTMRIIFVHH